MDFSDNNLSVYDDHSVGLSTYMYISRLYSQKLVKNNGEIGNLVFQGNINTYIDLPVNLYYRYNDDFKWITIIKVDKQIINPERYDFEEDGLKICLCPDYVINVDYIYNGLMNMTEFLDRR